MLDITGIENRTFKIVGVWHYSTKAVILLDIGMCILSEYIWLKYETKKVVSPIEVPKIGKEIANLLTEYQLWKVTETKHIIRPGHMKMYGYSTAARQGVTDIFDARGKKKIEKTKKKTWYFWK